MVSLTRMISCGNFVEVVRDEGESKYGCYFVYSKTHCHKYVLVLNRKTIIVTIISINRDWQRMLK